MIRVHQALACLLMWKYLTVTIKLWAGVGGGTVEPIGIILLATKKV